MDVSKHIPLQASELELRDEFLFVFLILLLHPAGLLSSHSDHVTAGPASPGTLFPFQIFCLLYPLFSLLKALGLLPSFSIPTVLLKLFFQVAAAC